MHATGVDSQRCLKCVSIIGVKMNLVGPAKPRERDMLSVIPL